MTSAALVDEGEGSQPGEQLRHRRHQADGEGGVVRHRPGHVGQDVQVRLGGPGLAVHDLHRHPAGRHRGAQGGPDVNEVGAAAAFAHDRGRELALDRDHDPLDLGQLRPVRPQQVDVGGQRLAQRLGDRVRPPVGDEQLPDRPADLTPQELGPGGGLGPLELEPQALPGVVEPARPAGPADVRRGLRELLRHQLIQPQARQRRQLVEHPGHRASRLELHVLLDRLLGDLAGELLRSVAQDAADGMLQVQPWPCVGRAGWRCPAGARRVEVEVEDLLEDGEVVARLDQRGAQRGAQPVGPVELGYPRGPHGVQPLDHGDGHPAGRAAHR